MPVLSPSAYDPGFFLTNGHLQTVYPVLFRPMPPTRPQRERIETPDNDCIDLDWHARDPESNGGRRLAVVLHGLEGHSRRKYVAGMARALTTRGWDVVALNFRGCGEGGMNRHLSFYHSGFTEDLHTVLGHALDRFPAAETALIGFSIGGNKVLKYLGEAPDRVPRQVKAAVAVSVPCDLAACSDVLGQPSNRIYEVYFLRSLRAKIRAKHAEVGHRLDVRGLERIRTRRGFDDRYTAPMFGFDDALDYYRRASCGPYLSAIEVPTLILNAADDPFLSPDCYPRAAAEANRHLCLEIPRTGGHVGFVMRGGRNEYFSETRTAAFLNDTW
jgi:predicted alpha/beta-fold hydrolase